MELEASRRRLTRWDYRTRMATSPDVAASFILWRDGAWN